jgi:hypothetical protein
MIRQIGIFRKQLTGEGGRLIPSDFPLSPNFAHLEEYYDSRGLTFANGATVTTWPDLSGHSPTRDMTTVGLIGGMVGPTMIASGGQLSPKGKGLVSFNGTNSGLTTGTINPFPVGTRGHTFYTYARWAHTSAPPAAFAGAVIWITSLFNSVCKELGLQTVGTNLLYTRDSGGFHTAGASPSGIHQIAVVMTPPNVLVFYVDGVVRATSTYTLGGNAADTTALSDCINNNVPLNADMGHFVWYSDAHTAAQVALFYLWASIYWGF